MLQKTARGVARAQRLSREVIHDVARSVRPGDREIDVTRRIEDKLSKAGVHAWLHTAYAWWGDRTRFARFVDWEPDALATDRRLAEDEPFILDVAPIVDGYPADYALSGHTEGPGAAAHRAMLDALAELKRAIPAAAEGAVDGSALFDDVRRTIEGRGLEVVHDKYPAGVLGHVLGEVPRPLQRAPRVGDGFQLPIIGAYAMAIVKHRFFGGPFPFVNADSREKPRGVYAVEPHLARGAVGAKFESILVIDGDETRWLDPDLFGEVAA
jgi:Xaa-Pro aminopeptidase